MAKLKDEESLPPNPLLARLGLPVSDQRDPRDLRPHPDNLSGTPSEREKSDLRRSMLEFGPNTPFRITDDTCHSPAGTVLDDNNRRDAAVDVGFFVVPVLVYSDLSQADEQLVFAAAQMAGRTHCELPAEAVFRIGDTYESEYRSVHGVGQGRRAPTSVHRDGSSKQERETSTVVARYLGVSPSFYRACKVVFGNDEDKYEKLRDAVRADRKFVRKAAETIRSASSVARKQKPRHATDELPPEPAWLQVAFEAWFRGMLDSTEHLAEPDRSLAVDLGEHVGATIATYWKKRRSAKATRCKNEVRAKRLT